MPRKNIYTFLFLSFFIVPAQAQSIFPMKNATMNIELAQYISEHPNSTEMMNILVQGNVNDITSLLRSNDGVLKFAYGDIASVRIPLNKISVLLQSPSVKRIEAQHGSGTVLDNETDINANITPVKQGAHPLPQGYDGSGVVIGIIDDGIDLSHADFKNELGNTRIKYLWSQIDNTGGTTPSYGYGQEWDSAAIDAGCPYISTDANYGHGSNVAGCAAGNGLAVNDYYGVATNADIIFVAVNFGGNFLNNIVDATDYIYSKAAALGKPCVINASVGRYSGSHDAQDLPAKMIDNLITAQNGRSFVCSAGNAGNIAVHLGYQVQKDSLFSWFRYEPSISRVFFEVWANKSEMDSMQFALGADRVNPYNFRGRTSYYNILSHFDFSTGIDTLTDTLRNGNNILGVIQILAEKLDTTYHLGISVFTDSISYNWRFITFGSGYFDIWSQPSITGTSNIVKPVNLPSASVFSDIVRYKAPDRNQTIVSSFTCSDKTIAVANFNNKNTWLDVNNNLQTPKTYTFPASVDTVTGEIGSNSSWGPTRDGRMKPDISAPGNFTFGSGLLSLMPSFISNNPGKVGVGGKHILGGGTSMASPVVAGIVALYLQKRPDASWQEIKDVLLNTAKHDIFTTVTVPNTKWGYGKADAFAALNYYGCMDNKAANYDSLAMIDDGSCNYGTAANIFNHSSSLFNYPNPFSDFTNIHFKINSPFTKGFIAVTNALGKEVARVTISGQEGNINFAGSSLQSGIYFYRMVTDGKMISTKKMVVF